MPNIESQEPRRTFRGWRAFLPAVLAVFALGLVACEDDGEDEIEVGGEGEVVGTETATPAEANGTTEGADTPTGTPEVTGGGDVSSLDDAEVGAVVEFSGELGEVTGANTFTVEGGDLEEPRVVFLPQGLELPPGMIGADGSGDVEVVGEVVEIIFADLETDYGITFGDDEEAELADWEELRGVVARFVQYVPTDPDADVEEDEIGEVVIANGEIGTVHSERLFTVSGEEILGVFGGADTLVFVTEEAMVGAAEMVEGAEVLVTGVAVQIVVADLETEYFGDEPFTDDEDTALEEYDGDVGIVATSLRVIEP